MNQPGPCLDPARPDPAPGPNRPGFSLAGAGRRTPGAGGPPVPRRSFPAGDYVQGVRAGDRTMLARAITLIESTAPADEQRAQEVLQSLLPHSGQARRIGITGIPGVGKSTFIEALGLFLVARGHKLAVLTIDPTSQLTRGSILGDKTRMNRLCQSPAAYIRPSPSGRTLGGVARRTRETMLLCEAAGFDTVLVETVGVGQSETALRSMVDLFLLLQLPGAGDELQGIKKGITEMADLIAINKADGDNLRKAELARQEQQAALHYLRPAATGWIPEVVLCSGLTGGGIPELWARIEAYFSRMEPGGQIAHRRREQTLAWLDTLVEEELRRRFYGDPRVAARLPELQQAVLRGGLTAVQAAATLLATTAQPH